MRGGDDRVCLFPFARNERCPHRGNEGHLAGTPSMGEDSSNFGLAHSYGVVPCRVFGHQRNFLEI